MRQVAKLLFSPVLWMLEVAFDFYTSPLPQIAERLKMIFGWYEIGTTRFIKKHLRGGIAIDIGANVGYYATLMAKYADHVYAFEPDPDNFALLERNCRSRPNITPLNVAVSDREGVVDFFKVKDSAMRHSLIDEGNTTKISVASTSLDVFICKNSLSDVSLLKIDAEGAEPMIFSGMKELIETNHPIVIFEGDDSYGKAINTKGDIVEAGDAPWWGTSKRKVTNLVWYT